MAYTSKDIENERKKQQKNSLSLDKLSNVAIQGTQAASLLGGLAKQAGNALKTAGYGIGLGLTALNKPKDYTPSEEVTNAKNALNEHYNSKPGEYQSAYADQIQGVLKDWENTKDFQYDFNADPLYQLYKDQYIQQGNMAMMDTMANAAALSGGYGNSYASTVGNQAYQASLGELNNIIPDLYDRAYSKYRDDKNDKLQHMQVLQSLDDADYQKYQDTLSDYYNTLNYLQSQSQYLSESEYNKYLDKLEQWQYELEYFTGRVDAAQAQSNWQSEQNRQVMQDIVDQSRWQSEFNYQKEQDALAQQNWQSEFDHMVSQDALAQQNWQSEFDYTKDWNAQNLAFDREKFDYEKDWNAQNLAFDREQFNHQVAQDNRNYNLDYKKYLAALDSDGGGSGDNSGNNSGGNGNGGNGNGKIKLSDKGERFMLNNGAVLIGYRENNGVSIEEVRKLLDKGLANEELEEDDVEKILSGLIYKE